MMGLDDISPAFVNFSFSWLVFLMGTLLSTVISSLFFLDIFHFMFYIFMYPSMYLWDFLGILVVWRTVRFSLFRFLSYVI